MNNINWAHFDCKDVNVIEYNEIVKGLIERGITRIFQSPGARTITGVDKVRNHFFISKKGLKGKQFRDATNQIILYVADSEKGYKKYCCLCTEESTPEETGFKGWQFINEKFREEFGIRLDTAFTNKQKFSEIYWKVKKCVCSPINFVTQKNFLRDIKLHNCYKADESSSYPAKLLGKLPTFYGCKVLPGRIEPSEEFPFAFYVNSGHMKIFNELDTRNFDNEFYLAFRDEKASWKHFDNLPDNEEETVLCRASEFNLESMLQKIYAGRKEHPEYKQFMNMCIGYFHNTHPQVGPQCSHLASVVMARCVKSMSERAKKIKKEGNEVILINTDSIAWIGNPSEIVDKQKKLGAFVSEHEGCEMIVCGVKKYQIHDLNTNEVKTVCSGLAKKISRTLEFGGILDVNIKECFYKLTEEGFLEKFEIISEN